MPWSTLYEELGSYRGVAAVVGCDHKTVKAWLEPGAVDRRGQAAARVLARVVLDRAPGVGPPPGARCELYTQLKALPCDVT